MNHCYYVVGAIWVKAHYEVPKMTIVKSILGVLLKPIWTSLLSVDHEKHPFEYLMGFEKSN
jgi:hypothetical protein